MKPPPFDRDEFLKDIAEKTGFGIALSLELEDFTRSDCVIFCAFDRKTCRLVKVTLSQDLCEDDKFDAAGYVRSALEKCAE